MLILLSMIWTQNLHPRIYHCDVQLLTQKGILTWFFSKSVLASGSAFNNDDIPENSSVQTRMQSSKSTCPFFTSVVTDPAFTGHSTIVKAHSKIKLTWRISGSKGGEPGNQPIHCKFNTNLQVILLDGDEQHLQSKIVDWCCCLFD